MATMYGTTAAPGYGAYGVGVAPASQDADEKFWRTLIRAIPVAVRLGQTLLGQQKGITGPMTVEDMAQDKNFLRILQTLLPLAARVVSSLDEPGGMASDTAAVPGPEQEKFWGAIARLVPIALQVGSALLSQRKGAFGGPVTVDEVADDKGFFDILRALLPIASQVVGSLDQPGGTSSDASTPTGVGMPTMPQGAEQEKFWGILAAVVPAAVSLVSSLVGRRKSAFGGGAVTADEIVQDKGFFDILRTLLPIASRVVASLDQPGGMASDAAPSPEQEKFWGAIARLVPIALQVGSALLAQRKGAFGGGAVTAEEIAQDKGFLDILRTLLPLAGQIINLDQPGGASDMSGGRTGVPSAFASAFR